MTRFLLFLCTGFLLISCGYHKEKHDNQKVFNMLLPAGLSSLDPAFARDQSNSWMISQIFNGLVQLDTNLEVQPCIAKSWEIRDSGRVYVFHLRQDVVFHPHETFMNSEDRRVRAQDFVYSFNRIVNPETGSFGQWIFNGKVVGADSTQVFSRLSGFEALNDSTLKIQLVQPFPAFLSLLSMPYASVVSKRVIEKIGKAHRSNPIGTGPFVFKSWREGESLILLKNPQYFEEENGVRLPYLDAVRVEFSSSPLTAFHKLVRGDIDFLNRPDLSLKEELFEKDGSLKSQWLSKFYLMRKPQLNTEYLGIQMDTALLPHPLHNLYFRKAIAYAIDRDKLVGTVLNGMGYAAHGGIVPPGMPLSDTGFVKGIRYNIDSAKYYLKLAGFPNGRGLSELSLLTSPSYQPVMEMIQYQLSEVGIRLTLDNGDGSSLREMIYQGKVAFWRASWIADYPDAENYLSLFYGENRAPSGPNTTRYQKDFYDAQFRASLLETKDSVRMKYHERLQQELIEDVPVILLYYDRIIRLIRNEVSGLEMDAMNNLNLKRVRKR
jgi:peptide/nickel transport system substrate-binding protein